MLSHLIHQFTFFFLICHLNRLRTLNLSNIFKKYNGLFET